MVASSSVPLPPVTPSPLRVLAVNSGSSSLKFAVYDVDSDTVAPTSAAPHPLLAGDVDGIGTSRGRFRATAATTHGGSPGTASDVDEPVPCEDHAAAVQRLVASLQDHGLLNNIAAVGQRLAHGGPRYRAPVRLTPAILQELHTLTTLAPAHLPQELRAVEAVEACLPTTPQIACFDTAFHATLPRVARLYGISHELAEQGIVRYGFHGLSYEFIVDTLRADGALGARTVVAHLGSGVSLTALLDGDSIDTSMGFTPTGGVVMSTRSGDLDPGILLYLLRDRQLPLEAVNDIVRKTGGVYGLSGGIADMRDLLRRAPTDPRAEEAVAVFCYQVSKCIGSYVAALGGLDTLVFTGGIGEHSTPLRARVCERMACFGVRLDPSRNAAHAPGTSTVISADGSPVTVRVVRTNEEIVIARHVWRLLCAEGSGGPPRHPTTDTGHPALSTSEGTRAASPP